MYNRVKSSLFTIAPPFAADTLEDMWSSWFREQRGIPRNELAESNLHRHFKVNGLKYWSIHIGLQAWKCSMIICCNLVPPLKICFNLASLIGLPDATSSYRIDSWYFIQSWQLFSVSMANSLFTHKSHPLPMSPAYNSFFTTINLSATSHPNAEPHKSELKERKSCEHPLIMGHDPIHNYLDYAASRYVFGDKKAKKRYEREKDRDRKRENTRQVADGSFSSSRQRSPQSDSRTRQHPNESAYRPIRSVARSQNFPHPPQSVNHQLWVQRPSSRSPQRYLSPPDPFPKPQRVFRQLPRTHIPLQSAPGPRESKEHDTHGNIRTSTYPLGNMKRSYIEGMEPNVSTEEASLGIMKTSRYPLGNMERSYIEGMEPNVSTEEASFGRIKTSRYPLGNMERSYIEGMEPLDH